MKKQAEWLGTVLMLVYLALWPLGVFCSSVYLRCLPTEVSVMIVGTLWIYGFWRIDRNETRRNEDE